MGKHTFSAADQRKGVEASRQMFADRRADPSYQPPRRRTGRPQSEFFNGKAHTFTRADALKSLESRRRKAREKVEAATRLEQQAQARASDPTFIAAYPNPEKATAAARRLIEIEQELEARQQQQRQRQVKAPTPSADPQRRRLLPNETPLEALRRINFPLYRDLLAKARYDESKVLGLLEAQGRQLW